MMDYISRQEAVESIATALMQMDDPDAPRRTLEDYMPLAESMIRGVPAAPVREVVLCKDCLFGHLYIDVINGESDSWVECRNPEGLHRDASCEEYCSAAIRRKNDEEIH